MTSSCNCPIACRQCACFFYDLILHMPRHHTAACIAMQLVTPNNSGKLPGILGVLQSTLEAYSKNPRLRTCIFPSQPKHILTKMIISTYLGYFRFLNTFLFSEEKDTLKLRAFSGMYLNSFDKICRPLHYSWCDKSPMCSKRILNIDLSYLPN